VLFAAAQRSMTAKLTDFAVLNAHMESASYVEGVMPSQKDMSVFKAISEPPASFPHALRWYKHIKSFSEHKVASLPGAFEKLSASSAPPAAAAKAPAPAPAAAEETNEKGPKGGKPTPEEIERLKAEAAAKKADGNYKKGKGGDKKEEPKKEVKKEEKKEEKKADAGLDAKALEKLKAKIIKEGGKKGVEIEGASDMGGLDFFCTTMELPEGNLEYLTLSMDAMNADPDPEAEDRKGCSGHVGKMIFSAGVEQLAIVAYVPAGEHNKSAGKVDIKTWIEDVCKATGGTVVSPPAAASSPKGGSIATAIVKSDPSNGKFAIKDKDTAMAAAFTYLRAHGAFPDDDGDDSDEMVFGDDDNLDDY